MEADVYHATLPKKPSTKYWLRPSVQDSAVRFTPSTGHVLNMRRVVTEKPVHPRANPAVTARFGAKKRQGQSGGDRTQGVSGSSGAKGVGKGKGKQREDEDDEEVVSNVSNGVHKKVRIS